MAPSASPQSVLIAPLNWGLGHAARCIPLVREQLAQGNHVTLAGDGEALTLLRKHFPDLPVLHLASLNLHYSAGKSQVWAMLHSIPHIILWAWRDHQLLKQIVSYQHFDCIISDNRFGLFHPHTHCIYITHQLMVKMPRGLHWAELLVHWLHTRVIHHYTECWIPDYPTPIQTSQLPNLQTSKLPNFQTPKHPNHQTSELPSLSGDLSHKYPLPKNARFIGPLSRFSLEEASCTTATEVPRLEAAALRTLPTDFHLALLSGLEPQRTLLEQEIIARYKQTPTTRSRDVVPQRLPHKNPLLLVRGKVGEPFCCLTCENITLVPYLSDAALQTVLLQATHIIARSGYSTIMDLAALHVLSKAELIPTPGQTEQEYLASYLQK